MVEVEPRGFELDVALSQVTQATRTLHRPLPSHVMKALKLWQLLVAAVCCLLPLPGESAAACGRSGSGTALGVCRLLHFGGRPDLHGWDSNGSSTAQ